MKAKTGAGPSTQTRPSCHKQPPRERMCPMPHFSLEWLRSLWIPGTLVSWVRLRNVAIKEGWGFPWGYDRQVPKKAQMPPPAHTSGRAREAVQGRTLMPDTGQGLAIELAPVLAASDPTAHLPAHTFKWETRSDPAERKIGGPLSLMRDYLSQSVKKSTRKSNMPHQTTTELSPKRSR